MSELTKEHIKQLVENFYTKVQADDLLGPIFNEVAQVDWDHHIPLLCGFWNSVMLKTNEYNGGAYAKHMMLADQVAVSEQHFERWLALFSQEAKVALPTNAAEEIICRAKLIAESLKRGMLTS